jgi:hypothetical protein
MPTFPAVDQEVHRKGEIMRIWKLMGIAAACLTLVAFMGCGEAEEESAPETQAEPEVVEMAVVDYAPTAEDVGTEITCGICGMTMAVTEEMPALTYDGKNYFFCSDDGRRGTRGSEGSGWSIDR